MQIGFLGCGNMGGAILQGALNCKVLKKDELLVSVNSEAHKIKLEKEGIKVVSNLDLVKASDFIIVAIKPNKFDEVIDEIKKNYTAEKVIVSIAAGISIDYLKRVFNNQNLKVVRVMPNTPAIVNEAMSAMIFENINDNEKSLILDIFNALGKTIEIKESEMDAIIALSGSSPAYFFMFMDSMIKTGLKLGIDEERCRMLVSQSALGSAKMALTSNDSVEQLKVNVCSPNGTTIEAVKVLEEDHIDKTIEKAMNACAKRSKEINRE